MLRMKWFENILEYTSKREKMCVLPSKENKRVPEKVATTRTEGGHV